MSPDIPLGVWLHLIEKFSLNHAAQSFIHPSTYSSVHSSANISTCNSFIHMPKYFFPSTCSSTYPCFLLWTSSANICSQPARHFSSCFYIHVFLHFPPSLHPYFYIYIHSPILPSTCPFYFPVHLSNYVLRQPSIHSSKHKGPVYWLNLSPGLCEMGILMLILWGRLWN